MENELYHHGVKGQVHGIRNGPPYPLYRQDRFKDKGAYTKIQEKNRVSSSERKTSGAKKIVKSTLKKIHRMDVKSRTDDNGYVRLKESESVDKAIRNVNPYKGTTGGSYNCTSCGLATHLRMSGYDVTAKSMEDGTSIKNYKKCITNYDDITKSIGSGRLHDLDSAKNTIKSFCKGKDSDGIISIEFGTEKQSYGSHAFNWVCKDGNVEFMDGQNGMKGDQLGIYFSNIRPSTFVTTSNLSNAKFDHDKLKNFVKVK